MLFKVGAEVGDNVMLVLFVVRECAIERSNINKSKVGRMELHLLFVVAIAPLGTTRLIFEMLFYSDFTRYN